MPTTESAADEIEAAGTEQGEADVTVGEDIDGDGTPDVAADDVAIVFDVTQDHSTPRASTPRNWSRRSPSPRSWPTTRRDAAGRVVRRAHPVGVREEGHRQPPRSHPEHEHGGQDLRGRDPDGGRRRVQERSQADRAEEGLPRLPARALPHGRRVLVLHPQHPGCHRVRRPEPPGPEADAAHPARGAHVPVGQGRRRRGRRRAPSPASSTRWARACA